MIGKILGDRYEIIEKIGGGGMAEVYKAKCKLLKRFVAVKVLRDQFINDEEVLSKFKREAESAASLSHPNIVNVYDVGEEGNLNYIVMEYIDGNTLKDFIKEKGHLEDDEVVRISTDIAEALKVAHLNGIVHRDIKPHNIMMTKDKRVKVTDFGIARAATSSTITNTGSILGSAHYISPEQARGGFVDMKSDIYSLGVVMYEMATGHLPYNGDSPITVAIKHIQEEPKSPSEVKDSISKGLEQIIKKCMMKDQNLRYANAEELIRDLKGFDGLSGSTVANMDFAEESDSKTQMLPIIDDKMMEKSKKLKKNGKDKIENKTEDKNTEKKKSKPKNSKKITIIAIVLSLVLVSAVSAGYLYSQGFFSERSIVVPNLVGMDQAEASDELEKVGLMLNVKGREYSDKYEEGQITRQEPKDGESVDKESEVDVYLSKGKEDEEIKSPNLKGEPLEIARAIILENELEIGKISYEYSNGAEGTVISQTPGSGDMIVKGSKVDLVVSQGEKPSESSVPSIVGISLEAAKSRLLGSGLGLGTVSEEYSERPEGEVLFQSIEPGRRVSEGTMVNISISKGPEPIPEEENNTDGGDSNSGDEADVDGGSSDTDGTNTDGADTTVPEETPPNTEEKVEDGV